MVKRTKSFAIALLTLISVMVTTAKALPVDTPTGWWKFDESTGSIASDSSVNANDGTLVDMDNFDWVPGQSGNALDFDGTNDYVVISGYEGITGGNSRTCTAWIKTTTPSSQIINWGTYSDGQRWTLRVNTDGELRAEVHGGYIYGTTSVADGNWHHIAVVLESDGSPDVSEVILYVDGAREAIGDVSPYAINTVASSDVKIGVNLLDTVFFQGLIDDVRIYDYALSSEEIYHLLNPDHSWNPSPADGAYAESSLSWFAGNSTISHDVYFGTSKTAVSSAQRSAGDINGDGTVNTNDLEVLAGQWLTDPGAVYPSADVAFSGKVDFEDFAVVAADWGQDADPEFKGNQTDTTFNPDLTEDVTYYWRVDEINPSQPDSPWTGSVWSFTYGASPNTSYSYSDTWVAVDALGRELPDYDDCGPPRSDRYVGMMYNMWHGEHGTGGPYDVTKILQANPNDPQWGPGGEYPNGGAPHHWAESEMGYYLSDDQWVMRKHAYMLANADVDVIICDITNGFTYIDNHLALLSVFADIRAHGGTTPQIAFMANGYADQSVQTIHDNIYSHSEYSDLWFYWKGKPLVLAPLDGMVINDRTINYSSTVKNFFNFRYAWAETSGYDIWNWIDDYPQDYGWHESSSIAEEISVAAGRHANQGIGRSYHHGSQPYFDPLYALTGTEDQGLMFAEQWSRVSQLDPEFVFICSWNEWTQQRYIVPAGQVFWFLGELVGPGTTFFVDSYNQEFSRDIEPMKGGHTDNYYYQAIDGIRRYKGVRQLPTPSVAKTITMDGNFNDWVSVGPEYVDWLGDTMHRSTEAWEVGLTYTNNTGRNDFLGAKVARDDTYVYFYIRTDAAITSYTNTNWMMLFINSDQNYSTGWEGYDYVVNRSVTNSTTTTLKHTSGGWNWTNVNTNIAYRVSGNQMEIRVPRSDIGQGSGNDTVAFDFHWADNIRVIEDEDGDTLPIDNIIQFAIHGDSAPDRRFNYRYDTSVKIANPSFEYPNISGYQYDPSGSDWTPNKVGYFAFADSGSAFGNTSYEGTQVMVMQRDVSVSQDINGFEVGKAYQITWAEADRPGSLGGNTLRVLIDSSVVGAIHTVTNDSWVEKTSNTFTATSTTHTLEFDATNAQGGDSSVFIDAVSIIEVP